MSEDIQTKRQDNWWVLGNSTTRCELTKKITAL